MKHIKKGLSLMLALSMVFALNISANATEFGEPITQTKNADVGVSASIRGEVWHYTGYDNGIVWFEPTVKTIVSSSKTMAQVTVSMECRYNDTGYLMTSDGNSSGKVSENNANTVLLNSYISVYNTGSRIVVFSAHGATYSKSDVLYMTTLL
ncbi:MAG TPA: hypothetical protein DC027_00945 [Oscillibacter sp.]|jgi:hypothetical protein|nr:hypothetical protein [Oscillibacter sp.]